MCAYVHCVYSDMYVHAMGEACDKGGCPIFLPLMSRPGGLFPQRYTHRLSVIRVSTSPVGEEWLWAIRV
jgi:hypothetical protein